jgi:hypothetical protein
MSQLQWQTGEGGGGVATMPAGRVSVQVVTKWAVSEYMEIKGHVDATEYFLLQNLLSAQHVSGTIMPIIRRSRVIQMVAACDTWRCKYGLCNL